MPGSKIALRLGAKRSILVAMDICPLEELPRLNLAVEVLVGEEVIRNPVDLARTRLPCSGRDRQAEVGPDLAYARDQRALPHS